MACQGCARRREMLARWLAVARERAAVVYKRAKEKSDAVVEPKAPSE